MTTMTSSAPDRLTYTSEQERWQAVLQRDRRADGRFFYAVSTTGVYCRPTCGARLALRRNVSFFDTTRAAEAAGFRPCQRCRPSEPPLEQRHAEAIAAACRALDESEEPFDLDSLAAAAGMSRFHFQRVFKAVTGLTPRDYAAGRRAARVRQQLASGSNVAEALYASGYGSSARFYAGARRDLGMAPRAYREGGRNAALRFAVAQSSLGAVLVAASEAGICAIELGDDPEALVEGLQARFPRATLAAGEEDFDALVAHVVALVESPLHKADLPLDLRGTAFQLRVWRILRDLAPGTTTTYREVAQHIGAPAAARGVARACATNPVAIAVPCHRVVRVDGGLGGYRWGIERKQALLQRERNAVGAPTAPS